MQADYKRELKSRYDIQFDRLLAITNIPIRRYAQFLHKRGKLESYMTLLEDNFNLVAAEHVMCRSLLSIGWDGAIYDCDFNQMIEMPASGESLNTVFRLNRFNSSLISQLRLLTTVTGAPPVPAAVAVEALYSRTELKANS